MGYEGVGGDIYMNKHVARCGHVVGDIMSVTSVCSVVPSVIYPSLYYVLIFFFCSHLESGFLYSVVQVSKCLNVLNHLERNHAHA